MTRHHRSRIQSHVPEIAVWECVCVTLKLRNSVCCCIYSASVSLSANIRLSFLCLLICWAVATSCNECGRIKWSINQSTNQPINQSIYLSILFTHICHIESTKCTFQLIICLIDKQNMMLMVHYLLYREFLKLLRWTVYLNKPEGVGQQQQQWASRASETFSDLFSGDERGWGVKWLIECGVRWQSGAPTDLVNTKHAVRECWEHLVCSEALLLSPLNKLPGWNMETLILNTVVKAD